LLVSIKLQITTIAEYKMSFISGKQWTNQNNKSNFRKWFVKTTNLILENSL
jgi:hypothetical protein